MVINPIAVCCGIVYCDGYDAKGGQVAARIFFGNLSAAEHYSTRYLRPSWVVRVRMVICPIHGKSTA